MKVACSKHVNEPCARDAIEFLLISDGDDGWDARARCDWHPAVDDIPLVRRVDPYVKCLIVPIPGMVTA